MEILIHYEDSFADSRIHHKVSLVDDDIQRFKQVSDLLKLDGVLLEFMKSYIPDLPPEAEDESCTLAIPKSELKITAIDFFENTLFEDRDYTLVTPTSEGATKEGVYTFLYSKCSSRDFPDKDLYIGLTTINEEEIPKVLRKYERPSKEDREERERQQEYDDATWDDDGW